MSGVSKAIWLASIAACHGVGASVWAQPQAPLGTPDLNSAGSKAAQAQTGQAPRPSTPVPSESAAPSGDPAPSTGTDAATAPPDMPVPSGIVPSGVPTQPVLFQTAESPLDRQERLRAAAEETLRQSVLPAPIARERFLTIVRQTDPALVGSSDLLDAHSSYLAAVDRQNGPAVRQIQRLLPAAFTFDPAKERYDPRPTPELVALLALRDKSVRNLRAAERRLLDTLESATPAVSRGAYARAVLSWRLEELPRHALLPSTPISLLELLPKARVDVATLAQLEPYLADYARALSAAIEDRTRVVLDSETARAIAETTAGTLWRYAPADFAAQVDRRIAELDDGEFATEIAIRTIHFDALARIRARMQPRDGRAFVELWQRALHPSLFEDERLLSRMVEETLAHPAFSPDQSTALLDALETIYQRLEPLARKASESADRILPRLLERSPASIADEIDARLAMIEVQQRRRAIVREALVRIRSMLGDADAAQTARVEDAIASIDSLGRADAFEQKSLAARRGAIGAVGPATTNPPAPGESPRSTDPSLESGTPSEDLDATHPAADPGAGERELPRSGRGGRAGRGPRRAPAGEDGG